MPTDTYTERMLRQLGRLCGVDDSASFDEDDRTLHKQRLILADDDEPLPAEPGVSACRAPYVSPDLVAVSPGLISATASSSGTAATASPGASGVSQPRPQPPGQPEQDAAKWVTLSPQTAGAREIPISASSTTISAEEIAISPTADEGAAQSGAPAVSRPPAERLQDAMALARELEEQGRLVEASALIAGALQGRG